MFTYHKEKKRSIIWPYFWVHFPFDSYFYLDFMSFYIGLLHVFLFSSCLYFYSFSLFLYLMLLFSLLYCVIIECCLIPRTIHMVTLFCELLHHWLFFYYYWFFHHHWLFFHLYLFSVTLIWYHLGFFLPFENLIKLKVFCLIESSCFIFYPYTQHFKIKCIGFPIWAQDEIGLKPIYS